MTDEIPIPSATTIPEINKKKYIATSRDLSIVCGNKMITFTNHLYETADETEQKAIEADENCKTIEKFKEEERTKMKKQNDELEERLAIL